MSLSGFSFSHAYSFRRVAVAFGYDTALTNGRRTKTRNSTAEEISMENRWFKNAVIYCVDVDTFRDGNGDGIGVLLGCDRR